MAKTRGTLATEDRHVGRAQSTSWVSGSTSGSSGSTSGSSRSTSGSSRSTSGSSRSNQRFEQVDQRFEQVDPRFEEVKAQLKVQIEAVDSTMHLVLERMDEFLKCDVGNSAAHTRMDTRTHAHKLRITALEPGDRPPG